MLSLQGKVAIVTGGGGGLGNAHAEALASRGCRVVVNDIGARVDGTHGTAAPAEAVVKDIRARGGVAVADFHDVADEAESVVKAAVDRVWLP